MTAETTLTDYEVASIMSIIERLSKIIKKEYYTNEIQLNGKPDASLIDDNYNVYRESKDQKVGSTVAYNVLELMKETVMKYPGLFMTNTANRNKTDEHWEKKVLEVSNTAKEAIETVNNFLKGNSPENDSQGVKKDIDTPVNAPNTTEKASLENSKAKKAKPTEKLHEKHTDNLEEINQAKKTTKPERSKVDKQIAKDKRANQTKSNGSTVDSPVMSTRTKIIKTIRKPEVEEGFSLYGTKDEEGLYVYEGDEDEEDADYEEEDADQFEYDIKEITDDVYDGRTEHHIELELQSECDIHGTVDCDCPMYDDDFGPGESYDFTFEYNSEGRLVPTSSSVKEYFQSKVNETKGHNSNKITEIHSKTKKKKKNRKTKKNQIQFDPDSVDTCLFCDFEALYGHPPRQLLASLKQKDTSKSVDDKLHRFESLVHENLYRQQ